MSILGQAASGEVTGAIVLFVLTLVALGAAWRLGCFRIDGVLGPERVPERSGGWPVLAMLLLGTTAWLGVQMGLAAYKQMQWTKAGNPGQFQLKDLLPADYAFLSTIPGMFAVLVTYVTYRSFLAERRPRLGLGLRDLWEGVPKGMAALAIILPPVLLVGMATEWVYQTVQYRHPAEHELLGAMKDSGPGVRWLLVCGAVVVAPVIEELLFRGLFQTLLVWAFNNVARANVRPRELNAVAEGVQAAPPALPVESEPASAGRLSLGRWLAILVTAAVFAGIHPRWSVPPIFALAVGLGFAYERTGNLWVTMTVHALFNGFQTAYFLLYAAGQSGGSS